MYNGRYYWYRWMSTLQEGIFNQTLETRPDGASVSWPQDANFAVGAATTLALTLAGAGDSGAEHASLLAAIACYYAAMEVRRASTRRD